MEFRDLNYYCTLIETKSFANTAETYGVTQPAITAMAKRLQKDLGTKLIFQKSSRSELTVTPAGKVLYLNAKKLIQQEENVKREVLRASQNNFRLGYSELAGNAWLANVITKLNRGHLLAHVETHMENSRFLEKHLCEGKYDAIIFSELMDDNEPEIKTTTFNQHEYKLIVPSKSPLAQKDAIDIRELDETPFIMRHKRFLSRVALEKVFEKTQMVPKKKLTIDSIDAITQLVAQGMGVSYLMDMAIKRNTPGIKSLPLIEGQREFCHAKLGIRKDFIPNAIQQKCLDILKEN